MRRRPRTAPARSGNQAGRGRRARPPGEHASGPGRALLVGGYKGLSGSAYVVGELDAAGTGGMGAGPGPGNPPSLSACWPAAAMARRSAVSAPERG